MNRTLLAGVAGALICATPLHAQTRPQFRLDHWTTDQGLPSHTIQDIAQTSSGDLWLTTTGGLVRFDGRTFRMVGSGVLPNNRTFGLDAIGDTVFITLDAGGIYRIVGDSVSLSLADAGGWDVARDGAGALWSVGGLIQRTDSALRIRVIGDTTGLLGAGRSAAGRPRLWRDGRGDVWLHSLTLKAAARLRADGELQWVPGNEHQLIPDESRREVLFARSAGPLMHVANERGEIRGAYAPGPRSIPRLLDRRGRLWITRANVVEAYAGVRGERVASFALASDVNVMTTDAEGNLWLGTPEHGLYRIQEVPFTVVDRSAGFAEDQVLQVTRGDAGSVLASTRGGAVYLVTNGSARRIQPRNGGVVELLGADTDARGIRWLGTARRLPSGSLAVIGEPKRGADVVFGSAMPVSQFAWDPTDPDALWFPSFQFVYRAGPLRGGGFGIANTFETAGYISDVHVDRAGVVWTVGIDSAGLGRLSRIANGVVAAVTPVNGLPTAPLRALMQARDGAIWFGSYGGGLTRLRNDTARTITRVDGLYEDVVSSIIEDDAGNFWMGGNRSIHRVNRAELNAYLDGTVDRVTGVGYGRRDGIINPEGSGGVGVRTEDGRLWFPTFSGIAVVDPGLALALDSAPPRARVIALRAADHPVDLAGGGRLAANQRQLEFVFGAVTLRSPDRVRSAYRLDNVDDRWTSAGPEGRVTYRGLSPGPYTFRVRAMNAGGVWSATDAVYSFTIAPHFYEQWWFFLAAVVLLGGLIFLGYDWRVRALLEREAILARRVEERTAALAAATQRTEEALRVVVDQRERLRELDRAKSRLVANVSHEFRTPLALVMGPLEDVRDGRAGPVTEEARTRLERGLANARRLVGLVDQLLDAAMLESGKLRLHLQPADLVGLLRRLAESFSSMAERQGIRFRIATPVGGLPVRFDPDQLDKVFTNLLGNAFKFTAAGGEVTLEATREGSGEQSAAVVTVRDTGIGIPPEHLPRVFERFYQVDDSQSRAYEGAGLGLTITKEIVELHGGSISVESQPGHGTSFTVRLPVSTDVVASDAHIRPVPAMVAPAPAVGPGATGAVADDARTTVLLVEDNTELRSYLRDMLSADYRVLEAGRGDEALDLARATPPDLIVSDIMMPGMDGQSLCEAIKADADIGFVPVILLTAKASLDSKISGLQVGADDYLTKPVDRRELLARIANIIHSRRRLRERFAASNRELPSVAGTWDTAARPDAESVAWLERLASVIAAELSNEDLDADRLAELLAMSRSTLYRQTERLLGRSPMAVVWDRRLDQAALWLARSEANVSEIAYGVGFKSVPHFSTRFRTKFGESPSAYRNRQRPPASQH